MPNGGTFFPTARRTGQPPSAAITIGATTAVGQNDISIPHVTTDPSYQVPPPPQTLSSSIRDYRNQNVQSTTNNHNKQMLLTHQQTKQTQRTQRIQQTISSSKSIPLQPSPGIPVSKPKYSPSSPFAPRSVPQPTQQYQQPTSTPGTATTFVPANGSTTHVLNTSAPAPAPVPVPQQFVAGATSNERTIRLPSALETNDSKFLFDVLEFLIKNRPSEFEKFITDCSEHYRMFYSRSKRTARNKQLQQLQPHNTISPAGAQRQPIHFHTRANTDLHLQPAVQDAHSHALTPQQQQQQQQVYHHHNGQVQAVPVDGHVAYTHAQTQAEAASIQRIQQNHVPVSVPVQPVAHAIQPQLQPQAQVQMVTPTQPMQQPQTQTSDVLDEDMKDNTFSRDKQEVEIIPDGTEDDKYNSNNKNPNNEFNRKRIIPHSHRIDTSKRILNLVQKRYKAYEELQRKLPLYSNDGKSYVIWRDIMNNTTSNHKKEVLLKVADCIKYNVVTDTEQEILKSHLNFLRFLWSSLTLSINDTNVYENYNNDDKGGIIFSHGIAFPKFHPILLFCQLYCTTFSDDNDLSNELYGKKKILLITTKYERQSWHVLGVKFQLPEFKIHCLDHPDKWYEEIQKWKEYGGLLILNYEDFKSIATNFKNLKKRNEAMLNLCKIGPDIVIMDECYHLSNLDKQSLAYLYRIQTKFKIGLTSLSVGSNLQIFNNITNWIYPNFILGNNHFNFYHVYFHSIINGNKYESPPNLGQISYNNSLDLYKKIHYIMFSINSNQQRRKELLVKNKVLFESLIELNLSPDERVVYKEISDYLLPCTLSHEMSCFVATYLLSMATISLNVVLRLIDSIEELSIHLSSCSPSNSPNDDVDEDTFDVRRAFLCMTKEINKTNTTLSRLREKIKNRLKNKPAQKSRKLEILLCVIKRCLRLKERIVIYVSCQELHEEIMQLLQLELPSHETNNVYELNFWNGNKCENIEKDTQAFNSCQVGAVLIAPFGVGIQCLESHGWGFVNATKVIILESSWFVAPLVQALNRVHSYAPRGALQVDVLYIETIGTIDKVLEAGIANRYERLQTAINEAISSPHLQNGNRNVYNNNTNDNSNGDRVLGCNNFPIHQIAGYRGYLVEPELAPVFTDVNIAGFGHYSMESTILTIQPPKIDRSIDTSIHPESVMTNQRKDYLDRILEDLSKLTIPENDLFMPLSSFKYSISRYRKFTEILEMAFDFNNGSNLRDMNMKSDEFIEHEDEQLLNRVSHYNLKVSKLVKTSSGNNNNNRYPPHHHMREEFYRNKEIESMLQTSGKRLNGFMELWKHYFMMYEFDYSYSKRPSSEKSGASADVVDNRLNGGRSSGSGSQRDRDRERDFNRRDERGRGGQRRNENANHEANNRNDFRDRPPARPPVREDQNGSRDVVDLDGRGETRSTGSGGWGRAIDGAPESPHSQGRRRSNRSVSPQPGKPERFVNHEWPNNKRRRSTGNYRENGGRERSSSPQRQRFENDNGATGGRYPNRDLPPHQDRFRDSPPPRFDMHRRQSPASPPHRRNNNRRGGGGGGKGVRYWQHDL